MAYLRIESKKKYKFILKSWLFINPDPTRCNKLRLVRKNKVYCKKVQKSKVH